MIDYAKELVSVLNNILPTHYELTLTSKTKTPCISWQEVSNSSVGTGNTREYSRIGFRIKVWGNDLKELQHYANEIDKALRPLGFTRGSTGELYDRNSTMIQKIINYEAIALETF